MIAGLAVSAFHTVFGTGGSGYGVPFAEGMTCCVNVIAYVRVAAMASVGGVALFRTSGFRNNAFVTVTGCGNCLGFVMLAILAISAFCAILGTGGSGYDVPFAEGMSGSVDVVRHATIPAVAGVSGVALLSAGGFGHYRVVAVPRCGKGIGLVMVAVSAVSAFHAVFGAGGSGHGVPLIEGMTGGIGVIRNVTISAVAGVSGVALLGTGGFRNDTFVAMSCCEKGIGFVVVAIFAISALFTVSSTGGSGHGVPLAEGVTCCVNIVRNVTVSAVTGVSGVALLGTSGLGHYIVVVMPCCGKYAGFVVLAVSAVSAFHTVFGAGGFLHRVPFTEGVTCCVNIV